MISCVQHAMVFVALTAKSGCTAFWTAGQKQQILADLYQIALQAVSGNKHQILDADAVSAHKMPSVQSPFVGHSVRICIISLIYDAFLCSFNVASFARSTLLHVVTPTRYIFSSYALHSVHISDHMNCILCTRHLIRSSMSRRPQRAD
jgi:hypothetical protein